MYNFKAKFDKILDICKHFPKDLVNNLGHVPRRGVVPVFFRLRGHSIIIVGGVGKHRQRITAVCFAKRL
jgi:hypothetical protein